ncbi:hypothetical protein Pst134EA_022377 [Puccinia striiformis f. sp. tritici]|uniref:hypothetical protein n=1 Tax=Puccinia striiformis f. sp. tritici TaxID=168172 RepID=UPI0020087D80|nr:hypothetical protein Pst134EA_022377 [Puccinia striiformis f. sp. tritici]KAH9454885.1 hypothetical protein Pst134EA_022377 [Puccinia striiformis f. sp. tritici]
MGRARSTGKRGSSEHLGSREAIPFHELDISSVAEGSFLLEGFPRYIELPPPCERWERTLEVSFVGLQQGQSVLGENDSTQRYASSSWASGHRLGEESLEHLKTCS